MTEHPLLDRWKNWAGTAREAADEVSAVLERCTNDLGIAESDQKLSKRAFDDYLYKGAVSAAPAGRGSYGMRQLLEAAATRVLMRRGWNMSNVVATIPGYDDLTLANIVMPVTPTSTASTNPAVDLVKQLQSEAMASNTFHPATPPIPRLLAAHFPSIQSAQALSSPVLAAAPMSQTDQTMKPMQLAPRLLWEQSEFSIAVDADIAMKLPEDSFRNQAAQLIEAAATHFYKTKR